MRRLRIAWLVLPSSPIESASPDPADRRVQPDPLAVIHGPPAHLDLATTLTLAAVGEG